MKTSNENSVITKKDLNKMFWRSLPMEFSWHYERQMHMGFCTMISDGLRKIYKNDPEGLKKALQRHLEFFNITPHVSTFVGGITLAMEEMNANQEDFDESFFSPSFRQKKSQISLPILYNLIIFIVKLF